MGALDTHSIDGDMDIALGDAINNVLGAYVISSKFNILSESGANLATETGLRIVQESAP